jgi:putative DNA primase/helicase
MMADSYPDKFARAQAEVARRPAASRETNIGASNVATVVSRRAADIPPQKVEWLWNGRLARGKHTAIAGEPGTGKSQVTIFAAAAITTAEEWPCGEGRAPLGDVIILSAEDGAADTIVPRLMAAGADLKRVHIVSAVRDAEGTFRGVDLQRDIEALQRAITSEVALVIIDPISAYMGGRIDTHRNSDVRGVLGPLAEMAERTGVAVLSVTHFSKSAAGSGKALHRFIGSIAFTAAARCAFAVIEDAEQEGRQLFLAVKNNLARTPQGLAYRLEQCQVGDRADIGASHVIWDAKHVSISANEAMAADAAGGETRTAKADATELLRELLAAGPAHVAKIEEQARSAGLLGEGERIGQSKPFRAARSALGVKSYQPEGRQAPGWCWRLGSGSDVLDPSDAPIQKRASDPVRACDPGAVEPDAETVL